MKGSLVTPAANPDLIFGSRVRFLGRPRLHRRPLRWASSRRRELLPKEKRELGPVPLLLETARHASSVAPRSFDEATLLANVKANPGQRGEQIAEAMGTDSKTIRRPMQKLIDDGAVRTKGERRGMRYYPV